MLQCVYIFLECKRRGHPSTFLEQVFSSTKRTVPAEQSLSNSSSYTGGRVGKKKKKKIRSFLCLSAFPAFLTAIDCVVAGLFIVQRKEKAPLEAGKLSWERIEGSVAAI